MLTLIYGCPTAGKSHVIKTWSQKTKSVFVDTDDLLMWKFLASSKFGFRSGNYRAFWDWWKTLLPQKTLSVCESLAKDLETLSLFDKVVAFTNFHSLGELHPVICFLREADSLRKIWVDREKEKALKEHRSPYTLPEWVKKYDTEKEVRLMKELHPSSKIVVLKDGEFMSDYLTGGVL